MSNQHEFRLEYTKIAVHVRGGASARKAPHTHVESFQSILPVLHKPAISLTDRLSHQQHGRKLPAPLGVATRPATSARRAARSHMTDGSAPWPTSGAQTES